MSPEDCVLPRQELSESYVSAIVWSVLLHVGIIAFLVFRLHFGNPELPAINADMIEAVMVDPAVLEAVEKKKQREAEQQRIAEEQRKREAEQKAAERRQQQEAQRLAEQLKAREEEQKKIALQQKLEAEKKAAEQKRVQEEQRKQTEARKAEEKRKQEAAVKAEERRRLEEAQKREQEQLRAEAEAAAAIRREAERKELASASSLYRAAIQQKVERHWIRPPSASLGNTCRVVIRQIPGGEVVSVKVESCQGDAAFQRSVEHAVYMASPLPEPPDPRVFDRDIQFTFLVKE